MNQQAKEANDGALLIAGALMGALLWHYSRDMSFMQRSWLPWLIGIVFIVLILALILLILFRLFRQKQKELTPERWHKMSGLQFERQMIIWLKKNGYDKVSLTEYYDRGVDIVALKENVSYAVQVKRSTRPVGVAAVRAVVAGLKSYGCEQAMVITNSTYTAQARRLARDNDTKLIGGSELRKQPSKLGSSS
ncbi:MAG: restriction endonuclease [Candidatus Saccharimonadales bacterium]